MEVIEIKELEDGGAEYIFDMTDAEQQTLFENGLKAVVKDCPEDHCYSQYKAARDAIIQLGILDAIVKGIKYAEEGQATSTSK